MNPNQIREDWYSEEREKVKVRFKSAKPVKNKIKTHKSPSGKYTLIVTPVRFRVRNKKTEYEYTIGSVYHDGRLIFNIHRSAPDFPFLFVEDYDGHDYLICAEDPQSRTVVGLKTGNAKSFISEKSKRGIEFCWETLHLCPDKNKIAIQGYVKQKPNDLIEYREIRFYKINHIMDLPWEEISDRITFHFEEFVSWKNEDTYVLSIAEEVRKSDGIKFEDLSSQEQKVCIDNNDIALKKTFYEVPLQEGLKREVYSEWL